MMAGIMLIITYRKRKVSKGTPNQPPTISENDRTIRYVPNQLHYETPNQSSSHKYETITRSDQVDASSPTPAYDTVIHHPGNKAVPAVSISTDEYALPIDNLVKQYEVPTPTGTLRPGTDSTGMAQNGACALSPSINVLEPDQDDGIYTAPFTPPPSSRNKLHPSPYSTPVPTRKDNASIELYSSVEDNVSPKMPSNSSPTAADHLYFLFEEKSNNNNVPKPAGVDETFTESQKENTNL